jgi:hypothetical protein
MPSYIWVCQVCGQSAPAGAEQCPACSAPSEISGAEIARRKKQLQGVSTKHTAEPKRETAPARAVEAYFANLGMRAAVGLAIAVGLSVVVGYLVKNIDWFRPELEVSALMMDSAYIVRAKNTRDSSVSNATVHIKVPQNGSQNAYLKLQLADVVAPNDAVVREHPNGTVSVTFPTIPPTRTVAFSLNLQRFGKEMGIAGQRDISYEIPKAGG